MKTLSSLIIENKFKNIKKNFDIVDTGKKFW